MIETKAEITGKILDGHWKEVHSNKRKIMFCRVYVGNPDGYDYVWEFYYKAMATNSFLLVSVPDNKTHLKGLGRAMQFAKMLALRSHKDFYRAVDYGEIPRI